MSSCIFDAVALVALFFLPLLPLFILGKEFKRKFRMPLALFRELVLKCVNTGEGIFKVTLINPVSKILSIPLELKILAVVRLLATGIKFYEAAELSG